MYCYGSRLRFLFAINPPARINVVFAFYQKNVQDNTKNLNKLLLLEGTRDANFTFKKMLNIC